MSTTSSILTEFSINNEKEIPKLHCVAIAARRVMGRPFTAIATSVKVLTGTTNEITDNNQI